MLYIDNYFITNKHNEKIKEFYLTLRKLLEKAEQWVLHTYMLLD